VVGNTHEVGNIVEYGLPTLP